jgi:hypothetical protein
LIVASYEKSNRICPKHCFCTILYEEVIEVLKDLFDHFWQEKEFSSYKQYIVVTCDAFWG